MTTQISMEEKETCPAQALLKMLSGKWKPEIFAWRWIIPCALAACFVIYPAPISKLLQLRSKS